MDAKDTKGKKPKPTAGTKKAGRPPVAEADKKSDSVYARLDKATLAAFEAFRDAQLFRPDRTAVIIKALHEYLERQGYWPPKPS